MAPLLCLRIPHGQENSCYHNCDVARRRTLARPNENLYRFFHEDTVSIHLYGRRMRAIMLKNHGGIPHPDSLVGRLVAKHGIVPQDAPIAGRDD